MKINWLSPLLPSKTAIADYAHQVLRALSQRAEIAIWTDQSEWDPNIEKFGRVHPFSGTPCWHEFNQADATFYNIGNNNAFHESIWEVSRQHSGIVILHDIHLQHLFAAFFKKNGLGPDAYRETMARHHGNAGLEATDAYLAGRMTVEGLGAGFPLTNLALENALGTVVHVPFAFDSLAQGSQPVAYVPLPCDPDAPSQTMSQNIRRRKGPPYQLLVFGYLGPNRRLAPILDALAALPTRDQFHLHIYGMLDKPDRWRKRIQQRGLGHLATIHGFVSESELDEALARSHLVLNLRYPSMGEASWTQLRLWSHGLPSLVTQTGWYGTIPENAVGFVRPEHEVADIQSHLEDFLRDPVRFAEKGKVGQRILQADHSPNDYVKTLIDFATHAHRFRGSVNATTLVQRTAEILGEWGVGSEQMPLLQDRIVPEIRRIAA